MTTTIVSNHQEVSRQATSRSGPLFIINASSDVDVRYNFGPDSQLFGTTTQPFPSTQVSSLYGHGTQGDELAPLYCVEELALAISEVVVRNAA